MFEFSSFITADIQTEKNPTFLRLGVETQFVAESKSIHWIGHVEFKENATSSPTLPPLSPFEKRNSPEFFPPEYIQATYT